MTRCLTYDVDDPSIMLTFHDRQHCLYHREKPEHFVTELLLQNRSRRCLDRSAQMCSGIVDENVDAAECLKGGAHKSIHRSFVGHVRRDADRSRTNLAQFIYRRVEAFGIAATNSDAAAFGEKRVRDGVSNSPGRAGDDRNFASQSEVHSLPASFCILNPNRYSMLGFSASSSQGTTRNGFGDQRAPRDYYRRGQWHRVRNG